MALSALLLGNHSYSPRWLLEGRAGHCATAGVKSCAARIASGRGTMSSVSSTGYLHITSRKPVAWF